MWVRPTDLSLGAVRLTPLSMDHEPGLRSAASDGALWQLKVTSVPEPAQTRTYIENALRMRREGSRLAFAVLLEQRVVGCTSYHDIVADIGRLEIGYTWYAKSHQRTALNSICKLLLMQHAFENLNAKLVAWRTDAENHASQRAIERLGARKDGVLRHHCRRRDGSVRDTVMYSMTPQEWPSSKAFLTAAVGGVAASTAALQATP
jgi:N-acetyltransferase